MFNIHVGNLPVKPQRHGNPLRDMLCVSDILSCLCSVANLLMMVARPVCKLKLPACLVFSIFQQFFHAISLSLSACHHLQLRLDAWQQLIVVVSKVSQQQTQLPQLALLEYWWNI